MVSPCLANPILANPFWIWCVSWPQRGPKPEKVWGARRVRGPKFRAFFFPSPTTNFVFLSLSLCVFSLNFGGVWKRRDPQMCTFGLSGCRVKPRRLWGRRRAPALQTPPKFNEKTSKRGREEEKKAKFWAVRRSCPAEGGPASLSPVEGGSSGGLWGSGFGVQGSMFLGTKTETEQKENEE